MSLGSGELERLTIRLAGLANDISRDAASSDCVGSFEVVSGQDSGVRGQFRTFAGSSAAPFRAFESRGSVGRVCDPRTLRSSGSRHLHKRKRGASGAQGRACRQVFGPAECCERSRRPEGTGAEASQQALRMPAVSSSAAEFYN